MAYFSNVSAGDTTFRIDRAVERRIAQLPEAATHALADALVEEEIRRAPRGRTGQLAKNIRAKKGKPKRKDLNVYYVGTRTRGKVVSKSGRRHGYGAAVEFGHFMRKANGMPTRWVPAQPYARPAREAVAGKVDPILKAAGIPLT